MSLVYRETGSGLVLAEHGQDEAGITRALKTLDRDLILVRETDARHQCFVWKVLLHQGDTRPALHVLDWRDRNGVPLPLSSGIVDAVNAQRKDRPGGYDAIAESDAANRRLRKQLQHDFEADVDEIASMFAGQLERGRKQVSLAPDTKTRYWQRNKHLPDTVREVVR